MVCRLVVLSIDALDPAALSAFWSRVLDRDGQPDGAGGWVVRPEDGRGFPVRFPRTTVPKVGRNRAHFDLTSASPEDQARTVALALEVGATPLDVGQRPEEGHVVLADPEGNEFCVIEAGNAFLAGCGRLGALSCDGTREVGCFWSAALGWPLVWDQDQETAIQSPAGGPKITWGGPPLLAKTGKSRWHLDLAPAPGSDQAGEVERLLGLGARRVDIGQGDVDWVVLADPDDNEFCVLTAER